MRIIETGSDVIQTYTGNAFSFEDIFKNKIDIEDVAHALAGQRRWSGHTKPYLSVAEHSCHCFDKAIESGGTDEQAFEALMHDAAEAYVVDVPRPIRKFLTNYDDLVGKVESLIMNKYELPIVMSAFVSNIDNRMLTTEYVQLIGTKVMVRPMVDYIEKFPPYYMTIPCWDSEKAEQEFMNRFKWATA